jgi:glucokinase
LTLTIGVDMGGTNVQAGVVDPDGKLLARTRRDTPAESVEEIRDLIVDVVSELAGDHPVEAVGIGAAGFVDAARSTVLFAPNMAWRGEPLRTYVANATGLPVVVENDANVAAWAEFRFGAAKQAEDSAVMVTVGTGIGGGIVFGGELIRGANGIAAELGHMLAVPDGHPCGCGRVGCLEQYASGKALVRFAKEAAKDDPAKAAALLELAGGAVDEISGPMVTTAAKAGDPLAQRAFGRIGHWLGLGLVDLVQILDPQVLVVGGGVSEAGELLLEPTREVYARSFGARGRFTVAEIRAAEMLNTAGMVGAADLARRR